MKILIAEDNRDSRMLVNDIVESLGHTPVLAVNGRVALEKIRSEIPDLVILDVNMPEVDGFEVCAAIKSNPATAMIPVIMLTAQSDIDSRVTGLDLGADDYLGKPFHPRELVARLESRLRAKEMTDTLEAQALQLEEQREQLRHTFERFVAHEVVEQLLQDPTSVELGGVETEVSVLFADLEGFTHVAVTVEPAELIEMLNRYHMLLVHHIKANGGTVNKYLGDGVMALYNTPLSQPDHALRAVQTALDIRMALQEFHRDLDPRFRMGVNIGIHTGLAVVGLVGTPELMEFTAIGDTVNLASRLQGLSEGSEITISEETYTLVAGYVNATCTGSRHVRGRDKPVVTYLVEYLR